MSSGVSFDTVIEDRPGAAWRTLFQRVWPGYRAWFLRGGVAERPRYPECRRALRQHMPELVPVWESLVELAGGGDIEARFLSLWCPPPFIAGCSQTVWIDPAGKQEPALLRNYDYAPDLLEGTWLATRWRGARVVAMSDCIWGALDGMNESGLVASLSFGGRAVSGRGFGVPVVLRYVLEVADSTAAAVKLLQRVPISMTYNITLLDRDGNWATVYVAPDHPAEVTRETSVTNYQRGVQWTAHAKATNAVERLRTLQGVAQRSTSSAAVVKGLLEPPLYQRSYERGYGTLYTAAYYPRSRRVELHWPQQQWTQFVDEFVPGSRAIVYGDS
ncbi:MAG TPA: C45 family peptidase [Burkholderiaceae bacterium]|nr:C45 family peptidase [Burkholderiaceae bacterium]